MDKKRLIGEEVPQITQGDIDAWHRGKEDAARNKLLAVSNKLSVNQAIKLIKMFAELGDLHYLALRLDVTVDEARKVLVAFDIRSIEDAKTAVRSGIIAEYDAAAAENRENLRLEQAAEHAEAEQRLLEQAPVEEPVAKSLEEQDAALAVRQDEARRKNKEDQLRQLIAEGLDFQTHVNSFRIPLHHISQFKQMIPHGVSSLVRKFGGSPKDIVNEIKRLSPDFDTDMLRP